MTSLLLILVLLNPSPQMVINREEAGGASPNDWSGSFVAVWNLEESSGTRVATSGSVCGAAGSDCDLTDVATVTSNTTDPIQGSAASFHTVANTEYLECASGTCEELQMSGATEISYGGWIKPGSSSGNRLIMGATASTNGYYMRRNTSNLIQCVIWDGSSAGIPNSGTHVDDEWQAVACTYSDDAGAGDDTARAYMDAGTPGTASLASYSSASAVFRLGTSSGSQAWDGSMDEMWVAEKVFSQAQLAHIFACGADGSDCACSGTTYTDEGKVDANCTGSGTPYACCTGSGTGCIDNAVLTGDCNAAAP